MVQTQQGSIMNTKVPGVAALDEPAMAGRGLDMYSQALKVLAVPRWSSKVGITSPDTPGLGLGRGALHDRRRKQRGKKSLRGRDASGKKSKEKGTESIAPPQSLWAHVEDYFREVAADDIEMLQPISDAELERYLRIPPLGLPYSLVWAQDDMAARERAAAVKLQEGAVRMKRKLLRASPVNKKRKLVEAEAGPMLTTIISPSENDDDELCHVCWGGDSDESNQILFCDSCDVAVHQECYGVAQVPEGPWLCARCRAPAPDAINCMLCPVKEGALKPVAPAPQDGGKQQQAVEEPGYAHLFCSQWIPETFIASTQTMEPVCNVEGINKERWRLQCAICREKHGACIQCAHGLCATAFHPLCARGAKLRMEVSSREGSDEVELRAYCPKHSVSRVGRELGFGEPGEALSTVDDSLKAGSEGTEDGAHVETEHRQAVGDLLGASLGEAGAQETARQDGNISSDCHPGSEAKAAGRDSGEEQANKAEVAGGQADTVRAASAKDSLKDGGHGPGRNGCHVEVIQDKLQGMPGMGGGPVPEPEPKPSSGSVQKWQLAAVAVEEQVEGATADEESVRLLEACGTAELISLVKQVMAKTQTTQTSVAAHSTVSQSMLSTWLQGKERPSQQSLNNKIRGYLRGRVTRVPASKGSSALVAEGPQRAAPSRLLSGAQATKASRARHAAELRGSGSVGPARQQGTTRRSSNARQGLVAGAEEKVGLGGASEGQEDRRQRSLSGGASTSTGAGQGTPATNGVVFVESFELKTRDSQLVAEESPAGSAGEQPSARARSRTVSPRKPGRMAKGSRPAPKLPALTFLELGQQGSDEIALSSVEKQRGSSPAVETSAGADGAAGGQAAEAPDSAKREGGGLAEPAPVASTPLEVPPGSCSGSGSGSGNGSGSLQRRQQKSRQQQDSGRDGRDDRPQKKKARMQSRGEGAQPPSAVSRKPGLEAARGAPPAAAGGRLAGAPVGQEGALHPYIHHFLDHGALGRPSPFTRLGPGVGAPPAGAGGEPAGRQPEEQASTPTKQELAAAALEMEFSPKPAPPLEEVPREGPRPGQGRRSSSPHPSQGSPQPAAQCPLCGAHHSAATLCQKSAKPEVPAQPLQAAGGQVVSTEGPPDKAGAVGLGLAKGEEGSGAELDPAAQLEAARKLGLLDMAPTDEVEGELLILQNQLLVSLQANRVRADRVIERVLGSLSERRLAERRRSEDLALVGHYMAQQREVKKQGRKDKREKEAQAQLAAATAAAAASPRMAGARREGSLVPGTPEEGGGLATPPPDAAAAPAPALPTSAPPATSAPLPISWPATAPPGPGRPAKPRLSTKPPLPAKPPLPRGPTPASAPRPQPPLARSAAVPHPSPSPAAAAFDLLPGERLDDADAVCAICANGDSEPPNVIVFCDRCAVAVHQDCYGVERIPSGPWFCQPCAEQRRRAAAEGRPAPPAQPDPFGRLRPGVQCHICPGRVGAFKSSPSGQWAHVFCAQWMPETSVGRDQAALVEGLENIAPERRAMLCFLCLQLHGACLTCNYGHCSGTFHPSCARNAGLFMSVKPGPGGRVQFRAYCDRHSPLQRAKVESKLRGGPADMAKLKRLRMEFERLRLICERVSRREKYKRELLMCSRDVTAARLSAAGDPHFRAPVLTASQLAEAGPQHPAGQLAAAGPLGAPGGRGGDPRKKGRGLEGMQAAGGRGQQALVQRLPASRGDARLELHAPQARHLAAAGASAQGHPARGPAWQPAVPLLPPAEGRAADCGSPGQQLREGRRRGRQPNERFMTPLEASLQNKRLPKGYAYIPLSEVVRATPRAQELGGGAPGSEAAAVMQTPALPPPAEEPPGAAQGPP